MHELCELLNKRFFATKQWLFAALQAATVLVAIAHFADMAAILNSIVLNIYYGMLRGQINMYLPPEHPIIDI